MDFEAPKLLVPKDEKHGPDAAFIESKYKDTEGTLEEGEIEASQEAESEEVFSLVSRWNAYLKERWGKKDAAQELVNINVFLELRGPEENAMISFSDFRNILETYYDHEKISKNKFDEGIEEFLKVGYPTSKDARKMEVPGGEEEKPKEVSAPTKVVEEFSVKSEEREGREVEKKESESKTPEGATGKAPEIIIAKPTPEQEKLFLSFGTIKDIIVSKIGDKAKIKEFTLTEIPEGADLKAELDAGMLGGKILLEGLVVNEGNGITIHDLKVNARGYVKSRIEESIGNFDSIIKKYFEEQYDGPVSNIHIEGSQLIIKLGSKKKK